MNGTGACTARAAADKPRDSTAQRSVARPVDAPPSSEAPIGTRKACRRGAPTLPTTKHTHVLQPTTHGLGPAKVKKWRPRVAGITPNRCGSTGRGGRLHRSTAAQKAGGEGCVSGAVCRRTTDQTQRKGKRKGTDRTHLYYPGLLPDPLVVVVAGPGYAPPLGLAVVAARAPPAGVQAGCSLQDGWELSKKEDAKRDRVGKLSTRFLPKKNTYENIK